MQAGVTWQPEKKNHDLAPELAVYALTRSFSHASHQCGRDSSTSSRRIHGHGRAAILRRPACEGSVRCPFQSLYVSTTLREIGTVHHHPPGLWARAHAQAIGRRRQVVVLFLRLPLSSCVVSKKLIQSTVRRCKWPSCSVYYYLLSPFDDLVMYIAILCLVLLLYGYTISL